MASVEAPSDAMANAPSWAMPTPCPHPSPRTIRTATEAAAGGYQVRPATAPATPAILHLRTTDRGYPAMAARTLTPMTDPLTPSEGWGVLHLFCAVDPGADAAAVAAAVKVAS